VSKGKKLLDAFLIERDKIVNEVKDVIEML